MRDLYHRYGPALRRKGERLLGNREDAEDVVQQLFIDLMSRVSRPSITLPYLYRAVTTRCLNRIRDVRRREQLLHEHGQMLVTIGHGDLTERLVSVDLLTRLLDGLDRPHAEVFVFLFVDRLTQAEAAELLGVSRKTVGNRLRRIRDALDALLESP